MILLLAIVLGLAQSVLAGVIVQFEEVWKDDNPTTKIEADISSFSGASVDNIELVDVKGGCFQMGDNFDDGDNNEKPVHKVCVDDFQIGKYEVTQGQWQEIMGNNPAKFQKGAYYPVEQVSWDDAQDFINKTNGKTGKIFRLPTEAEWEYACRSGGKKEKYCGGNEVYSLAWYESNSNSSTLPVGTKAPNGLGIYDMSGNVWEWVQDWYLYEKEGFLKSEKSYYKESVKDNPQGPSSGSLRVKRGGSWLYGPWYMRSANRSRSTPGYHDYGLGFRLVVSPGQ